MTISERQSRCRPRMNDSYQPITNMRPLRSMTSEQNAEDPPEPRNFTTGVCYWPYPVNKAEELTFTDQLPSLRILAPSLNDTNTVSLGPKTGVSMTNTGRRMQSKLNAKDPSLNEENPQKSNTCFPDHQPITSACLGLCLLMQFAQAISGKWRKH